MGCALVSPGVPIGLGVGVRGCLGVPVGPGTGCLGVPWVLTPGPCGSWALWGGHLVGVGPMGPTAWSLVGVGPSTAWAPVGHGLGCPWGGDTGYLWGWVRSL